MHSENSRPAMDRRGFLKLSGAGLAGAVLLGTTAGELAARPSSSLSAEFGAAAREYDVPREILAAMGHVNTLWEMPPPRATAYEPGDLHGFGSYGIMALYQNPSRDTLSRAADLTGLSEERLKTDRAANVRGGAAVLADLAGKTRPSNLNGWQEVVAEYGADDLYATQVYETLQEGASATLSDGRRIELAPRDVETPRTIEDKTGTRGYSKATWRPAHRRNFTRANRERSHRINKLIVHVVQGSASSAVNWFKNPDAQVSAHYVVRRRGGVIQCVRNEDIAWHAGNWKYNTNAIGIEHEGYADNRRTWTDRMYRASARLAAYCCRRHEIPVDRAHIIGHRQVPGSDHYCPGRFFDFERYLRLIRRYKRRL